MRTKGGVPDVFLVDLEVPEKSGFDFIKLLKTGEPPAPADRPIIMLTGWEDNAGVITDEKLGIYNYLLKPISKANLEKRPWVVLEASAFGIRDGFLRSRCR